MEVIVRSLEIGKTSKLVFQFKTGIIVLQALLSTIKCYGQTKTKMFQTMKIVDWQHYFSNIKDFNCMVTE